VSVRQRATGQISRKNPRGCGPERLKPAVLKNKIVDSLSDYRIEDLA
jgi:hypothetical protein